MKRNVCLLAMRTLMLSTLLSSAWATELPGYDFHYRISGDAAVAPVQVFDDGKHLYLQFKDQNVIPALFVHIQSGAVRLAVNKEFPYLVTDKLSQQVLVKLDGRQAMVTYTGGRALSDGGRMTGAAIAQAETGSAHIPSQLSSSSSNPFADNGNFSGELIFKQPQALPQSGQPAVAMPYIPAAQSNPVVQLNEMEKISLPGSSGVPLSVSVPLSVFNAESSAHHRPLYVVLRGDSMSRIAHRYGITVKQIMRLNQLNNANWLAIGQTLRIPARATLMQTEARMMPVNHAEHTTPTRAKRLMSWPSSQITVLRLAQHIDSTEFTQHLIKIKFTGRGNE